MRTCRSCNETKEDTEFTCRGGGRLGFQADCNFCLVKRARDYRQNTRNRVGLYKLKKGCEDCGFKAEHSCQLDLDYIDPETKTYKGAHKAFDAGWSWQRIETELTKCKVLCKNCHALRTYNERHWENFYTTVCMR